MGHFKLKNAAFPTVASFQGSEPFLLVSSFGASPFDGGDIYIVPNIAEAVKSNTVS